MVRVVVVVEILRRLFIAPLLYKKYRASCRSSASQLSP